MFDSNESNAVQETTDPPTSTGRLGHRGLEIILFVVGLFCLSVFGYRAYRHYRFKGVHPAPTGKIMAGLEEADQIPASSRSAKDFNLVIITMDTTRADHLQCYGNIGVKTPNINNLARNGVLFAHAYTPSPSTLPGHSCIMTGLYPYHHGARANGSFKLKSDNHTLAERLKEKGYSTRATISAYVLDSRFGLDQGFDSYDDDLTKGVRWGVHTFRERPGEYTNEVAFKWLDAHATPPKDGETAHPFFMWIHYFDAHAPYLPAEPYRKIYKSNLYDGEIAYVDEQIGKLVAKLEELGVRDHTLIVLAGDHGEGLGEHGEQSHSLLTYDATLHTPLIFNSPTLFAKGHVVQTEVSNVDIVPTVLDLLGVDSKEKFDGVSLLNPSKTWPQGIYFETISTLVLHGWAPVFGIRRNDYKYIHAPKPELYDVIKDPKELNNLFEQFPEQVVAMSKELDEHVGDDRFRKSAVVQVETVDPEVAKKLAALGYVGTKTGSDIDVEAAAQFNPRDMVPHFEKVNKANNMISSGKFREGVELLETCVEEVPKDVWALRGLSGAYLTMGQVDKAESILKKTLELEKGDAGIYNALSRVYIQKREYDKAKELFAKALEVDPNAADVWVGMATLASVQNDRKKAEEYYHKAIAMDPGTSGPGAYVDLGLMYQQSLEFDKARESYEKAIELDRLNAAAHSGLGSILVEENKLDEAMKEFAIAVRFNPNAPTNLASLASLFDKKHNYERARSLANRALDINPSFLAALNNLGLIEKHTGNLDKAMELFNRVLEKQPAYLACRINLALSYLARREDEKAVEQFQRVLQYNPRVPIALANIGVYHIQHGRRELAKDFFGRAIQFKPNYALAHAHLGMVLLQEGGSMTEALFHLKKSLELEPDQQGHEQLEYQVSQLEKIAPASSQPALNSQTNSPPPEPVGH